MKPAPGKYTLGEGVGLTLNEDGLGTVKEGLGVQIPAWKPEPTAEQPSERQEAVAWLVWHEDDPDQISAWMHPFDTMSVNSKWHNQPLYLHPSSQPKDEAT